MPFWKSAGLRSRAVSADSTERHGFILIQVEFEECDTLFLGRLLGVDPDEANIDWIGKAVQGRFRRNSKLQPTDIYFNLVD